jgi:hypothetical protein
VLVGFHGGPCGGSGRRRTRGLGTRSCGRSLFDIVRLWIRLLDMLLLVIDEHVDGYCIQKKDFRAARALSVRACGNVFPCYCYISTEVR